MPSTEPDLRTETGVGGSGVAVAAKFGFGRRLGALCRLDRQLRLDSRLRRRSGLRRRRLAPPGRTAAASARKASKLLGRSAPADGDARSVRLAPLFFAGDGSPWPAWWRPHDGPRGPLRRRARAAEATARRRLLRRPSPRFRAAPGSGISHAVGRPPHPRPTRAMRRRQAARLAPRLRLSTSAATECAPVRSDVRSARAATAASSARAARGIGRAASACSIRPSARTASPRPTRMRPPTIATAPGVMTLASKSWPWIGTPAATNTIPAAAITAPKINNNTYIRPVVLSPIGHTKSDTSSFWPPSGNGARIISLPPSSPDRAAQARPAIPARTAPVIHCRICQIRLLTIFAQVAADAVPFPASRRSVARARLWAYLKEPFSPLDGFTPTPDRFAFTLRRRRNGLYPARTSLCA